MGIPGQDFHGNTTNGKNPDDTAPRGNDVSRRFGDRPFIAVERAGARPGGGRIAGARTPAMISASAVTKRYPPGIEALKEVSFEIGDGEMVFITGHSGAGDQT